MTDGATSATIRASKPAILTVDDEPGVSQACAQLLQRHTHDIGRHCPHMVSAPSPSLDRGYLTDLPSPRVDQLELITVGHIADVVGHPDGRIQVGV